MKTEKLAHMTKKLLWTNRYTMEDISDMLGEPIEECTKAFEGYYNREIPLDLFIVGNMEARADIRRCIRNRKPCLVYGPNGVGKSSAVRKLATDLNLRRIYPLSQEKMAEEFGAAPMQKENKDLFVVEADNFSSRKYAILNKYVSEAVRPMIFIVNDKKTINGHVRKKMEEIQFSSPTREELKRFLTKKFNISEDKFEEVYDSDVRITMERLLGTGEGEKYTKEQEINAHDFARELSFGYSNMEDFEQLYQPLWWVIRSLANNMKMKFPTRERKQLRNMMNLSFIDSVKWLYPKKHIKNMLLNLDGSPRRGYFKYPVWPPKEKKEKHYKKLKKSKSNYKEPESVDLTSWL